MPAFPYQLPSGFAHWPPAWQAGALFLSTFVLEDVAAIGAGLLLAAGVLAWPWAFGACFLGIWTGDAGLYGLARLIGRSCFERTSLTRFSGRVARSERWFAEHGSSILVFSRLLPGARLPTYLAAGFLRLPLVRFLFITAAASLVWTAVVLMMTQLLGASLLVWLGPLRRASWLVILGIPLAWLTLHLLRKLAPAVPNWRFWPARAGQLRVRISLAIRRFFIPLARWGHWEFWPPWLFYPPVAVYCLWLAIKYRGLAVPTAANPGIFSGGIVGESKMATLQDLMDASPEFTAEAEMVKGETAAARLTALREICQRRRIPYPFILKPDVGQRGQGVKLIRHDAQAQAYLRQTDAPLLVQRYVPGPNELGIFYFRLPGESRGQIFAITEKIFPVVTGDGHSTISDLIWSDSRARFMAGKYMSRLAGRAGDVLAAGQTLKLVEAGNHAQGCIFRDGMRFATPALAARIDAISQNLPGFYIGRYDLRYSDDADLRAGRGFTIIELNGAASEATSIYDARTSLLSAYRTLFRQWALVFAIGAANRRRGYLPARFSTLWRKWREYTGYAATYPGAD